VAFPWRLLSAASLSLSQTINWNLLLRPSHVRRLIASQVMTQWWHPHQTTTPHIALRTLSGRPFSPPRATALILTDPQLIQVYWCSFLSPSPLLSPVHTTRVHGPFSRVSKTSTVNTGICPHCPCSWAMNRGSVYRDLAYSGKSYLLSYRITTCLKNLEMSGNFTIVR